MGKVFNPGAFKTRISFLRPATGSDEYGDPLDGWEVVKGAWAKKFDFMGTDFYAAQTTDTKIEVKFNCRYMQGITKDMRIQCGNELYEIIGVPIDIDNAHRELLIYCKAV